MPSIAGIYNIIADQGATYSLGLVKKDSRKRVVPLTGYTARMHVRESAAASNTVLELTTENDGLIIDAPRGMVTIYISSQQMTNINAGKYVYDLELIDGDDEVERLIMGSFTVRAEVTR